MECRCKKCNKKLCELLVNTPTTTEKCDILIVEIKCNRCKEINKINIFKESQER